MFMLATATHCLVSGERERERKIKVHLIERKIEGKNEGRRGRRGREEKERERGRGERGRKRRGSEGKEGNYHKQMLSFV